MEEPLNRLLKESRDAARDAVATYFRPLLLATGALDRAKSHSWSRQTKAILGLLTKAVCFNQGTMIEYAFLTAHKHEELKAKLYSDNSNAQEIKDLFDDLTDFMNEKYAQIVHQNFEFIREYFALKHTTAPRICLKGNFIANSEDIVVAIFRDQPVTYYYRTHITDDAAYSSIIKNGKHFCENNIPEAVFERGYVNKRLKMEQIKADFSRTGSLDAIIRNWDRYWREYDPSRRGDSSFYKSALIVPLTLWNNEISDEFEAVMNLRLMDQKIDRYIFGYLCLDHREIDYFDEEHDVSFGYIFADLLSVYAFTRMVYTEVSRTFSDVQKVLQASNIHWKVKKEMSHLVSRKLVERFGLAERAVSKRNKLIPTDEVLLKYTAK